MYMRFGRPATPFVYEEVPKTLGEGADVLREGKDISIFACGHMVWRALEAAEMLARDDGVDAEVVNVGDHQAARLGGRAGLAGATGVAVTAEEHRKVGGLADAVRDGGGGAVPGAGASPSGWVTRFGLSGTGEAVMERFGLTAAGIADAARAGAAS